MTDKLDMTSPDLVSQNIEKIAALFPNCVTESANGLAIDFDQLKQELSKDIVEGNKERYRLEWPGKREAIVMANLPINKTLRPVREDSVDFDNTENLYIEGDNLEVLKLLQESYLGKIKMIYIDPPYNTGKDFVYKDNFTQDTDEYQEEAGLKDEYNNRLVANPDTSGRYHSDWLTMMYPRLKLARNLLTDDGVIFISIDDNEYDNLKKLCDEIFGTNNFIANFIWQNKKGGGNDARYTAIEHEYILFYSKSKEFVPKLFESYDKAYEKRYKEVDEEGKFYWDTFKRKSGKQYYPIECPDGLVLEYDNDGNPISWLRSKERFLQDKKDGEVKFVKKEDGWSIFFKQRMPEGKKPRTLILDKGTTSSGSSEVLNLFKKDVFSNPKPIQLIKYLLGINLYENDIVLDFFSGSGTTAHSLLELISDSELIKIKYILVQLPENIRDNMRTASTNERRILENGIQILGELGKPLLITELAKERIKRGSNLIIENKVALVKLKLEAVKTLEEKNDLIKDEGKIELLKSEIIALQYIIENLDKGFRVYKLDSSNMQDVYYTPTQYEQGQLDLLEDNIKPDRNSDDLVAQIMLDWGLPLSLKIEQTKIANKNVFKVADDALLCCFDEGIDEAFAKEIATLKPLRIVFRDKSFKDDTAKENVKQLLKQLSADSEMKVI